MPFAYIENKVKPERLRNNRASYRERWWIHAEARPGLRRAWSTLKRYIATPRVAKHRVFVFVPMGTVPDSRVAVITRDDNYFFGVLHSRIHEVWSLALSPRHGVGNDPTYNAQSCFETYPFPWPPGAEPTDSPLVQAIVDAARDLVQRRDAWLNEEGLSAAELKKRTLTNLYNERPQWLADAHQRLDAAVLAAYGWPADISDEQILAQLLALNLERAAKQGAVAAPAESEGEDEE